MGAIASTISGDHSCGAFPHDGPPQPAHYFKASSTGILLHYRSWAPPAAPRATIYLVHGYGEHLGRHEPFALALAAAGFSVHALDLQGHGQSHGDRAFLTSLDDVVADVLELATRVVPPQPGVPSFIFGHSVGLHRAGTSRAFQLSSPDPTRALFIPNRWAGSSRCEQHNPALVRPFSAALSSPPLQS